MNILLDTISNSQKEEKSGCCHVQNPQQQRLWPCTKTPTDKAMAFYTTLTNKAVTLSTL